MRGHQRIVRSAQRSLLVVSMTVWCLLLSACQPYRIEHVKRPDFYQKASKEELPSEVRLDDGTIVKYESRFDQSTLGVGEKGKVFQPREETEDALGRKTITLRAILPEHVLVNTLNCLRNEEYQLLWEQGLAQRTKDNYAEHEQGEDEFVAFMKKQRHELVATLTRMIAGMSGQEVAIEYPGDGVTRCRLRRQIADPFKFKSVDMVRDDGWLKLLLIQ